MYLAFLTAFRGVVFRWLRRVHNNRQRILVKTKIIIACDSYLSEGFKSTQSSLKCKETGWIFLHSASFSLKSFVGYCGRNVTNVIPLLWSQSGKQDTLPSATELKRYLKKKNFWVIIDLNLMWLCFKAYISWTHHLSDWNIDRYNLEWWKYWHRTGQSHS